MLTDVTTDMVITKEETFGPVAPLYRFKSDARSNRASGSSRGVPRGERQCHTLMRE